MSRKPLEVTNPEERDDVVLGYGLQQAGGPGEALQTCPAGGEEGADDDDPGRGPGQGAHHQVLVHCITKPAGRTHPGIPILRTVLRLMFGFPGQF